MTRNRFEFIDDILCGVDATPERVEVARALLKEDFEKSENAISAPKCQHALTIESLDALGTSLALAGLDFIIGDSDAGHEKLANAISLIDSMNKQIKKWR